MIIEAVAAEAMKSRTEPIVGHVSMNYSAGWTYYWSRLHSRKPVPDHISGSTNFGACRALHKVGIATEFEVKTDIWKPWDGIVSTDEINARAKNRAIASYHRIDPNPAAIKAAIAGIGIPMPYKMSDGSVGKTPVACAWPVYEDITESYDDGIMHMPKQGVKKRGGHSTMVIGWDVIDDNEYWVSFGSWGKRKLGDFEDISGGIHYIPVEYPFYPNDWWQIIPNYVTPPEPVDPMDDPNYVGPWRPYKGCQIYRKAYYDEFVFTSSCTGNLQAKDIETMHKWINEKKTRGCWFKRRLR